MNEPAVSLTKYADSPVSTYSGGCVRRLEQRGRCAGAPHSRCWTSPRAGVDPASRRRVWRALRANSSGNSSVLISSHSMDEMEALCHRIAILNQGWVCALGDLGTLRRDHAAGHSLQIKLKRGTKTTDIQMQKLKEDIKQKFKCTLKDEHKSMLYYNIDENLPYSDMFTRIEELKAGHSIIEDYTVHEMTLEEVFLNLAHGNEAKKQQV
ncbi:unnamed protein product [Plutella xylostella]|uniref:(diamondback moth) hypothetical protein n=1 Tax=Plutella xylostella TaxID=51655 RepID=A0A8S4G9F3_PLUXY|nr:unnamed protein product [Plutella xylostella]